MKLRLGQVLRTLKDSLGAAGLSEERLLTLLCALIFAVQISALGYFIAQAADSRPVIAGLDNDGANAIDVAGRSTWITDNGFTGYGPVYFRLANTLAWVMPEFTAPGGLPAADGRTKALHFCLMLTSLAALSLLCLLLARLATRERWLQLLLAAGFMRLLLMASPWQEMLLRPHPDHLLALFAGLATVLMVRLWRHPHDAVIFRLSAWSWGLAVAVKLSMVLYLPWVLGALFYSLKRERWRAGAHYIGHMFLAYLVAGFPQHLNLPRTFRFLSYQSQVSAPADWVSVQEWLRLWSGQIVAPLILAAALLGLSCWRARRRPAIAVREYWFGIALAFGPLLLMLPQKVLVPHAHYPFPVVATQLALVLLALPAPIGGFARRPRWLLLLVATAVFGIARTVPDGLNVTLSDQLTCRAEARTVFTRLLELQAKGAKIYIDPYVPARDRMSNVQSIWQTNKDYLLKNGFDALILNAKYYGRYLQTEGERYYSTYNKDFLATRELYTLFHSKDRLDDEALGSWHLSSRDSCGWEIWEKL